MLAAFRRTLGRLRRFVSGVPALPFTARHLEYSIVASADDEGAAASSRLIDVTLESVRHARDISMKAIVARMDKGPFYPQVWPGEHYKLLAGLVRACRPKTVIEIGTAEGLSALALRQEIEPGGRVVTIDIVPWNEYPSSYLRDEDFADGSLAQVIADVSKPDEMARHAILFRSADIIFADGPKDGRFEALFLKRLEELSLRQRPILVLDDIRVWNMLAIWRGISRPKLDLTSFGHWTGTGLVDWICEEDIPTR